MNETEKTTFSVPSPGELEQLTELHKAMGDYTRMRILWYLMQKDSCVSELAQKMEVTESAISHQLRALRIVRLVQSRKAGKNVIYSLQDEHIRWILEETYAHISERLRLFSSPSPQSTPLKKSLFCAKQHKIKYIYMFYATIYCM